MSQGQCWILEFWTNGASLAYSMLSSLAHLRLFFSTLEVLMASLLSKEVLKSAKIRGTSMLTRLLSDVVYEWDCALSVYLSTEWKRLKITSSHHTVPSHVDIRSLKYDKVTNGKHWSLMLIFIHKCLFKVEMKL